MLTVPQAATRLGVSPARVRALIAAGRLTARKLSGAWVIQERALDARRIRERRPGRPRRKS